KSVSALRTPWRTVVPAAASASTSARKLSVIACALTMLSTVGVLPARSADLSAPRAKTCISVYRYGGAASGWITDGPGTFANGTFKSIRRHIETAQGVFVRFWVQAPGDAYSANVDWVWSGVVEDLADPFDDKNGDIR